jgi:aldehyde dehydrogenase (NAD+)
VGEWLDVGAEGADAAVQRASAAYDGWSSIPAHERSQALVEAVDRVAAAQEELAALVTREVGKPRGEALSEVQRTVAILRFYAQAALDADGETFPASEARSWLLARRRPRGVVALITPWNFPLAIPAWKLAPALAWGNSVVLKPAREGMATATRLAQLLGLPRGVLEILHSGTAGGGRLASHPDVRALSFTGSTATGRSLAIATTQAGIPFQAEMGGSNASIVLDDADLDRASRIIAGAAMGFAGQKCTSTSRVVVIGDEAQACDAIVAAVEALRVGDPTASDVAVGPVISAQARGRVLEAAERAVREGGRLLTGGVGEGRGWFIRPIVLRDVAPGAELSREEVFGPICVVLPARNDAEAARIADATPYGLVASVFTRDLDRAMTFVDRLHVGMLRVNAPTTGVDFHAPFGGTRASSMGPREQGRAAREFYTSTVTITISPSGDPRP